MTEHEPQDGGFRAGVGGDNSGNIVSVGAGGTTGDIGGIVVQGNLVIQLPQQEGSLLRDAPTNAPPSAPIPGVESPQVDTQPYASIVAQALAGVRAAEQSGQAIEGVRVGDVRISKVELLLKRAVVVKAEAAQLMAENMTSKQQELQRLMTQFYSAGQFDPVSIERFQSEGQAAVWRGFDRESYVEKLTEAQELFEEALALDETNTEALLQLADLLMALTPEDVRDEERVLARVHALLQHPSTDDERFMQAQAMLMSAMSIQLKYQKTPPGAELMDAAQLFQSVVTEARDQFARLGRTLWANWADGMLQASRAAVAVWAGPQQATGTSAPPSYPGTQQPGWQQPYSPPDQGFQPAGQWTVNMMMGMTPTGAAYLTLGPNHSLQGVFSPTGAVIQGRWDFTPMNHVLTLQGYTNGIYPFNWQLQLVSAQYSAAVGVDNMGRTYNFFRAA